MVGTWDNAISRGANARKLLLKAAYSHFQRSSLNR
jgi:hypothetical protein